jgi:hypothetical protein
MIHESAAVIATAAKKETPVEAALTETFAVFAGDRRAPITEWTRKPGETVPTKNSRRIGTDQTRRT